MGNRYVSRVGVNTTHVGEIDVGSIETSVLEVCPRPLACRQLHQTHRGRGGVHGTGGTYYGYHRVIRYEPIIDRHCSISILFV